MRRLVASLVVLMVAGCGQGASDADDVGRVDSPLVSAEMVEEARKRLVAGSADAMYAEISESLPEFAGMYVDREDGHPIVMFTAAGDEAAEARAREILAPVFARSRELRRNVPLIENRTEALAEFRKAEYSFLQLLQWYPLAVDTAFADPRVTMSDIDQVRNRLVFGLETPDAQEEVAAALARAGVPPEVVAFKAEGRNRVVAHLRDKVNPAPGGMQIDRYFRNDVLGGDVAHQCTLGYMGTRAATNVWGFVTAAHCGHNYDSLSTGQTMYQPVHYWWLSTTDRIGTINTNPGWFNHSQNAACPSGKLCRHSDSMFVAFAHGGNGEFKKVAKVSTDWLGNHNIVGHHTSLGSIIDTPWVGEWVHKVGRTTGYTNGFVDVDCANVEVFDHENTPRTFLCSSQGSPNSSWTDFSLGGDSGAHVWMLGGTDYYYGYGIVIAGNAAHVFTWSPGIQIEADLGDIWDF